MQSAGGFLTTRQLWTRGYASFLNNGETRTWELPDSRLVELPEKAVVLHQILGYPNYVGRIDDVVAAAFYFDSRIERLSD